MKRYLEASWFRHALLLMALLCGGLVTLVVPTYEEVVAAYSQSEPSQSESASGGHGSKDVTGFGVRERNRSLMHRAT